MLTQPDLDSIEDRAQRLADGMTINRDLFAKDVARMCRELRQWRSPVPEINRFQQDFQDIFTK